MLITRRHHSNNTVVLVQFARHTLLAPHSSLCDAAPHYLQILRPSAVVAKSFFHSKHSHKKEYSVRKMATLSVGYKHKVTVVGSGNWYVAWGSSKLSR